MIITLDIVIPKEQVMALVRLVIAVAPQAFPAGTIGGNYRYSVDGAVVAEVPDLFFEFDAAEGDHTAEAVRLDDAGNPLGASQSAAFTVPPANVAIDTVSALTVELL